MQSSGVSDSYHYSPVSSVPAEVVRHNVAPSDPLKQYGWEPGQSGNPAGRPLGARARISEKLLADLATVWEAQGESVLRRLAIEDPGKLAQIAYGLLPRDVFISVEQRVPGNLDPDEWAILRRVIDLIQVNAKGAELGPVLESGRAKRGEALHQCE